MKRTLALIAAALCLLPVMAGASNVVQVVRIIDTSGSPVSGVSFTAGGVALTAGVSATTVPGANMDTGAALTNQTLKYFDMGDGTGEYVFVYDPVSTQAHFALVATKSGVTISNPTVGLNFFTDPSSIAGTNTRVTTALPNAAPAAAGGLPTFGSGTGQLNPASGTFTGVTLASGQNVATVAGLAPPTNWPLDAIDSSGRHTLTPAEHTAISGTDVPAALNTAQPGSPVANSAFDHLAKADTQSTAANAGVSAVSTKLGAPAGASVSADIATANAGITTAVSQTTFAAIGHADWGAQLDPLGSSPLTMANAFWDMWCVAAGPSGTVTYSGSVQTTPYLRHDGTTSSWSSALTTNSGGKPLTRTPTITTRPATP